MTTKAVVRFEWVPNYVVWLASDGYPDTVLGEVIIPMIEKYSKNKEHFYQEFLSWNITDDYPADYIDYSYFVSKDGKRFTVIAEGLKVEIYPKVKTAKILEVDAEKLSSIKREIEKLGYKIF